jgi:integrase
MAEARFVLKEPNISSPTLVYLILNFNHQKLKYSTGKKIAPKHWNPKSQRARESKDFPDNADLNKHLKEVAAVAEKHLSNLITDGIPPTPEKIKNHLNERFFKVPLAEKDQTLFGFIDEFINASNKHINTVKQYKLTKNNLLEFKKRSRMQVDFETIDAVFYEKFMRFLLDKGYSPNTIGARIKNLKVFMGEAVERGLTANMQFKSSRFKKPYEKSESIYLSLDEIKRIYELDLSENPRLEKVRDLFIIGCYTGLRFSDLEQLRTENLIDNKTKIKIKTVKTGETVVIPLHRHVKQILEKYNGIPPQMISNQKMNDYLKELGGMAEINEAVIINSTKGTTKQTETYTKADLITSHTARRSFATNAYLNDIPSISIMKITGHSTEKAFLTYIKISQEDNANKLLNHPFFN